MIAWLQDQAQGIVAGGGGALILRELVAFALRLRARRVLADDDPRNDGEAELYEDLAKRVQGGGR